MEEKDFERCMECIRQGDRDALKEIYAAYAGYLFHLIRGIVGSREDAEDVTSEFFIRLWEIADRYVPGRGHRAWLSRIAHNMAVDFLRANKREIPYDHTETGFEHAAKDEYDLAAGRTSALGSMREGAALDGTADEAVAKVGMEQALSKLKPAEREIVHLKIVGDMTFEEIAKLLETPMGTVTWRYREAVKTLRRCGYEA